MAEVIILSLEARCTVASLLHFFNLVTAFSEVVFAVDILDARFFKEM